MNTTDSVPFLTMKQLSDLLGIPEGTLRQWRCSEVGPKWHKLRGSVRYDKTDVENFLHESERIPSVRAHMSDRMKTMLRAWCGSRKEGWVFPSTRSKSGHLTTIAKGFQAARGRAGLDKKLAPYSARHTYGTYTMEKSGNAFAVSKSMGHADLKSMEPYQHQELEPLRVAINQRNRRKKFGQVFGQVLENAS